MFHALLLSPDDQAVTAITGVLEEMSVTCERPLDGVSAAQKLNSHSFDLVLVDCENLPAAKLIFDVCRRGKNGNNPVPIAIVDGRAGLPTAFRLGAELILTKPVAKDQARGTIRTAVGRVRKTVQPEETVSTELASAATVDLATSSDITRDHAPVTVATASSQLTSFGDPAPSFVSTTISHAATSKLSAPTLHSVATPKLHPNVNMDVDQDQIDAPAARPKLNPQSASFSESRPSESSSAHTPSLITKPRLPLSDDPVMAELERTELEESERAEAKLAESRKAESQTPDPHKDKDSDSPKGTSQAAVSEPVRSESVHGARDTHAAKTDPALFSSYRQERPKPRGSLVALLMLALAAGGFYAAWTYQPGFRAIVQPQVDSILTLVGIALPTTSAPAAKPTVQPVPPKIAAPAPASAADSNTSSSAAPDSATSSLQSSGSGSPTQAASVPAPLRVQSPATPSVSVGPPVSVTTTTPPPTKPGASKQNDIKPADIGSSSNNGSTRDATGALSNAPLPGEKTAVILSSKGAENRLAHTIPPQYPVEARAAGADGTVVLKAVVDENGKVEGLRLVEGNAVLATAAIQAVKQWRYRPYVRDGKAQSFQTVVIVDFQRP